MPLLGWSSPRTTSSALAGWWTCVSHRLECSSFDPASPETHGDSGNAMHKLELAVATDHVEKLTKFKKPILAVEELVWNSLDADATEVRVELTESRLGGLERLTIRDNGHGITPSVCDEAFGSLGGSPKLKKSLSPDGRQIHGSSGEGRFKAFGLGPQVIWSSCYSENDTLYHFKVSGRRSNLKEFDVSDPKKGGDATGVSVEIRPNQTLHALLDTEACVDELSRRLALYLRKYPDIKVFYDGSLIDPSKIEDRTSSYGFEVQIADRDAISAELTIIEWTCPTDRALYLCDTAGFARDERPPRIQAKGWEFTAYVKSELVEELDQSNAFALEDLHPGVKALLDSSKSLLRTHFRKREEEEASHLVAHWREEEVYPYGDDSAGPLEEAEREVFNVCAVKVHEYLPSFEESDKKSKRLTFRLLKQALEANPTSLQTILREVLALPEEQQDELAKLLERTKLSAIINASQVVLGRLDFLASLDSLLFGDYKSQLLETSQMQQILLRELWIFGEQYGLGVDDQSLRSLLEKHLEVLGRDALVPGSEAVRDLEGKSRRVDLMLHQRFPSGQPECFEHLVIELKRPSVRIGQKEISQIEQYAFKVADDERFDKTKVSWNFVLLGNALDSFANKKCSESGRDFGHIHLSDSLNIYVKPWSSVIDPAKWRYEFYRDQLAVEISTDDGLEYLRAKYPQFLPKTSS